MKGRPDYTECRVPCSQQLIVLSAICTIVTPISIIRTTSSGKSSDGVLGGNVSHLVGQGANSQDRRNVDDRSATEVSNAVTP